jgi:hypothetical protein
MAVLKISSFGGISPQVPPRYLQDSQAQIALNCPMWNGSLQPLGDAGDSLLTLTKSTVPQTIYRFGQDTISDTNYWFHWPVDVDVCRSQIAGDASEWTFFTGDGGPKATYNALALATGDYPTVARPLGLPQPDAACTAFGNEFTADEHPAEVTLNTIHIEQLDTQYGLMISTGADDAADYTTVTLTSPITAVGLAQDINNALNTVTATANNGTVKIETNATGTDVTLHVKYQTGDEKNTDGTFVYATNPNLSATGTADTDAWLVIPDTEIGSISGGNIIKIHTEEGQVTADLLDSLSGAINAQNVAQAIRTAAGSKLTAVAVGTSVVIKAGTEGDGSDGYIRYRRYLTANGDAVADLRENGSESAAPARFIVTQTNVDSAENQYFVLTVNNGEERFIPVPATSYVANLKLLEAYGITVNIYGAVEPFAIVQTNAVGTAATLSLRVGDYPTTPTFAIQSAEGYIDEDESQETRVYTWTWVNKESGYEFESAPAPASNEVNVRTGQTVAISGLQQVPTGEYVVTNRRIYRAVNGVFLFVKEIDAANNTFVDDVKPENLAEELPSMTWSEPPQNLSGLTNLPNGMMAGFVSRDVYFCEPYRPHAWPQNYIQSIDYPVVGLGRMDTTLAVLTTGSPYFIQGSHPDSMVVVKSDIEQACVSKRSIVSHGGAVYYAAPDGLMMLSPGGSRIVTENMFDFRQWQAYFKPESIHAYQHDNQYIAFYDNGAQRGGFIYDMKSQQIILHDIYAETGYHDLQRDKLFLAYDDRTIRVWGDGPTKTMRWKSKKFTMPKPMSFAWGQLEAENYPLTVTFIADDTTIHTQTVTSRNPFRLPAKVGRDWEMQIDGDYEVFSLAIAHSSAELRDG